MSSPERAQALALLLDAGSFLSDAEGRVIQPCAQVQAWFGPQVYAGPWAWRVHPDDLLPPDAGPSDPAAEPVPRATDRRWRMADGSWRWFAHRTQAMGAQTLHVLQDIDARKRREIEHSDAAALLDSLRSHLPGVFYKLDADEQGVPHVTFVSDAVRDVLEYEPEEVEADFRRIFDRIHPDDRERFQAIVSNALRTNADTTFEYRVILPGKGVRHLAGRACSALQSSGRHARFGYQHDVTEQKLYQEALLQARAAEQASEVKSEFLSRMSHELRTPLNAILGFAQLLKMSSAEPLGEEQWARVDVLERAGRHLLALVNDVLDLSRIEAGSLPMAIEPLPIGDALDAAVALVSNQAADAQLHLLCTPPEPGLCVQGDAVRLRQILVNLLSNGVKYNQPGGRVMVEAMALEHEVVITVSDSGCGMSEAQLSHLFEPFNRLGAERTSIEGTGIGLVIVKRLVELMHGRIEVSSRPGAGTQFRVWLPRADTIREVHDAATRPRTGFGALDDGMPNGLTVLYAEDNVVNVELLRQVMRMRPQWHLEIAHCGQEAIAMAMSQPPDLLLLDMHLGDMNGLDVSDALDQHAHTAAIPRAALSADVMPDQIREARQRGFVEYLTKPLDVGKLLSLLDRCAQGEAL